MSAQIEQAAYNIYHLTIMPQNLAEYHDDNPLQAMSCAHITARYIQKEIKKITKTF